MTQPNSSDAEKGLLCSTLLDSRVLATATQLGISPNSFYHPAHAEIWGAFLELEKTGKPVDFVFLTQLLTDQGRLENVGGSHDISKINSFTYTATNWKEFAQIVLEKERRRGLMRAAAALQEAAEKSVEMSEVEQLAQAIGLESAKSSSGKAEVIHIKHAVVEFLNSVEAAQMGTDTRLRLQVGLPRFEELTHGMPPGTHMVIGAQTSVGKTALALQFAWNVAFKQQKPVVFISLEMTAEKLGGRIASATSGVSLSKLYARKPDLSDKDFDDMKRGLVRVDGSELYICTPRETPTASHVAAIMRAEKIRRPELALVVVDYLQLLAPSGNQDNRERQVAEMSNTIMRAAVGLNVTTIVLSQLNDDGMLRESRAVGHDARIVATLTRPKSKNKDQPDTGERTLYLDKNSEGQAAIPIQLHFDGPHQTFREVYDND